MSATINQAVLNAVAMLEAFDRDCAAANYTDTGEATALIQLVVGNLRPHLDAGQLQELAEMKSRHEAEIEREDALADAA